MCYNGSWVRLPSCEGCAAPSSVTFAAEPSCAEGRVIPLSLAYVAEQKISFVKKSNYN